jgi:hypothetical protein
MQKKPTLVMVTLENAMTLDDFTKEVNKLGGHVVNAYQVDESQYVLQLPDTVPHVPVPAADAAAPPPDPVVTTVTNGLGGVGTVSQIHWCH